MSMLARAVAPRAIKSFDQQAMASPYGQSTYVPLLNLQSWTGNGISPDTGLNVITVYQCVRILAETYASLPLILYRRLPNGGKERATDHPLYSVLHDRPNPDMTSFVWRELMMSHLATWGNAYNEIAYDNEGRLQLWPIRPDRIEPRYDDAGRKVYDYLSLTQGRTRLQPGTIFHIAGLSSNGLAGLSPITLMRSALGLYKTAETFGESFFRNGARPATVLSHPKTLSDPAIHRLAGQMDDLRGSGNAGKTVILEEGMTITEVGIPPEDAQYMQTRLFEKREIAAGFRIPPHKVGDLERATFSNIEHQSLEFIQDAMMPWFVRSEQEFQAQIVNDPDYFVEFLVDGYLRGDAKTRADVYAIRWQHGNLNADDWRALENENPLPDGLGQQYYVPVNYAAVNPTPGVEPVAPATVRETITEGGPMLSVVKSAEWRCAHLRPDGTKCNAKLAEVEGQGTVITCQRCRAVSVGEAVMEHGTKTVDPLMAALIGLATREQQPSQVNFAAGAFKSDVHVPATTIAEGAVQVSVAAQPAPIVNVPRQAAPTVNFNVPDRQVTRKRIEYGTDGRPSALIEEPA